MLPSIEKFTCLFHFLVLLLANIAVFPRREQRSPVYLSREANLWCHLLLFSAKQFRVLSLVRWLRVGGLECPIPSDGTDLYKGHPLVTKNNHAL